MIEDEGIPLTRAAAALGISTSHARRLFDDSAGAAGIRSARSRARLFDPAWVRDQAALRAERSPARPAPGISISQAAAELGATVTTVRRWFDRDQPDSGEWIQGRTNSGERRCYPAWVRAQKRRQQAGAA